MNANLSVAGRWVLVTGASSGLGRELARQLAAVHKANPILVARRAARLLELKTQLEREHGVQCRVVQADLAKPDDVERVYAESIRDAEVYGAILNAGVTYFGRHRDLAWPELENMLATNVTSVVRLVSLFVPYLIERNQGGGILVVSSLAGVLPVPYQAAYAGTKGFVTQFGQSLIEELRGENVSLTVFCPGGIATEMVETSGLSAGFEGPAVLQDVQSCAAMALRGFARREPLPVPRLSNQALLFLTRFLPRSLVRRISGRIYRDALRKAPRPDRN
jgi:short-subunit dehydrogenase